LKNQPDALAAADDTRSESAIGILGERSADTTFSMRNERNRTLFAYSGNWHSPSQSGTVASSSPSDQGNSDFEELPELKASEILKPEVC